MITGIPIEELRFAEDGNLVNQDVFIKVGDESWVFYEPDKTDGMGFRFVACEWMSSDVTGKNISVETVCHGLAYFDGIRHMYFGGEYGDDGYIHYPHLDVIGNILKTLRELEIKYCRDPN